MQANIKILFNRLDVSTVRKNIKNIAADLSLPPDDVWLARSSGQPSRDGFLYRLSAKSQFIEIDRIKNEINVLLQRVLDIGIHLDEYNIILSLVIYTNEQNGVFLNKETIRLLSKLSAELDLNVYGDE